MQVIPKELEQKVFCLGKGHARQQHRLIVQELERSRLQRRAVEEKRISTRTEERARIVGIP